ncbi:hypothetical protein [uncultured Anaerococcus sp.]|uniref:hypothetical protein n=1 Tax=uncultured Anaerococcus sp. TaxID=293428 RepID=UPI0026162DFE|nr:hypothetical protein [uncultured Anaerococcus sp.]
MRKDSENTREIKNLYNKDKNTYLKDFKDKFNDGKNISYLERKLNEFKLGKLEINGK